MMFSLYVPGDSLVHRLPAGTKLLALLVTSVALFWVAGVPFHVAGLLVVCALCRIAGLPWRDFLHQFRPVLIFLVPIFLFHVFLTDVVLGIETVLRIVVLVSLAVLITLTTKLSDMIDVIERAARPLRHVGVNPSKVGMMLSMVIRFIPLMTKEAREILEAQRARGLDRSVIALLVPLLIKTLKMADNLSDAIEARGYDAEADGLSARGWERRQRTAEALARPEPDGKDSTQVEQADRRKPVHANTSKGGAETGQASVHGPHRSDKPGPAVGRDRANFRQGSTGEMQ